MIMKLRCEEILKQLKSLSNPVAVSGMALYGINSKNNYGVSIPLLRRIAKQVGSDHVLAEQLLDSEVHDAQILASLIDNPRQVTSEQMDRWVYDFDSWDVCDQCCSNLFDKTVFAYNKALIWCQSDKEFVKRAGFVLMAALAVHDKKTKDEAFLPFLEALKVGAYDDRNFVKKAVNWALRQIGKRNNNLNEKALETARAIREIDSKSAKWISSDATRELTSESVQKRLKKKISR